MEISATPPPPSPQGATWFRRWLTPTETTWRERFLGLTFLGAAGCLAWYSSRLSLPFAAGLWGFLVLALTLAATLGWYPLLGPIFVSEFVRSARRGRHSILRCTYAVLLFLFLLALYRNNGDLTQMAFLNATGMAHFAETFCYTFLAAQFLVVAALTPAYVAGSIAEEKERKTLEFLLATEVRSREIVFGKLIARLLSLGLLGITGLPILALTMLWGGVDPGLLLGGFLATGLTALSLGCLSLLTSVHARTAREAIVLAYLAVAGYLGLTIILHLLIQLPSTASLIIIPSRRPWTLEDLCEIINAGNPFLFSWGLYTDMRTGTPLPMSMATRMGGFVTIHLLLSILCLGGALVRMRPLALQENYSRKSPLTVGWRRHWRPRPGRHPLIWKEVWAEPGLSFNAFGKAIVILIVLVSFAPAVWIAGRFFLDLFHEPGELFAPRGTGLWWSKLSESVHLWVRLVGTLVGCLTLLGVAVRAASSVSSERDRETLDSLLTVPREAGAFLGAKWLGSVLSVRRAWIWLGLVWFLGILTGGLYLPSVPWLLLCWGVYASFLAALGLWFSVRSRTTLRATVSTLLAALALGVGHWYLWIVLCMPLKLHGDTINLLLLGEKYTLTPPLTLAWLAFRVDEVDPGLLGARDENPLHIFGAMLLGLVLWLIFGGALWFSALQRFRVLSGRARFQPLAVPEPGKGVAPRRRSWRGTLATAGALGIVALVVWGARQGILANKEMSEALAETQARDPQWQIEQLEAARAQVSANNNGALAVMAARSRMPPWGWPARWDRDIVGELSPAVRLTTDQISEMTNALEEIEGAFDDLLPIFRLENGRHAITYAPDGLSTVLRHVDAHTTVQIVVLYRALLAIEQGNPEDALNHVRAYGHLGSILGDEPIQITQLVRLRTVRLALRLLQRLLAHGEPSVSSLIAYQEWLTRQEAHPGQYLGARGDLALGDRVLQLLIVGELSPGQMAMYRGMLGVNNDSNLDWVTLSLIPGEEKRNRAAFHRYMARYIEIARVPVDDRTHAVAELTEEHSRLPVVAKTIAPNPKILVSWPREAITEIRCAQAALAAECFRQENGRWPKVFEDLVPRYLKEVPKDPYANAPLRWGRLEDCLVIYSVGAKREDHGGPKEGLTPRVDTPPVIGFRLYDPQKRRQAAPINLKPASHDPIGGQFPMGRRTVE